MKKYVNRVFSLLMMVLVMSYYVGSTTFLHSHILDTGEIRTHSHPFSSSSHSHSQASFQLIDSLAFAAILTIFIAILNCIAANKNLYESFCFGYKLSRNYSIFRLRGPPVSFC